VHTHIHPSDAALFHSPFIWLPLCLWIAGCAGLPANTEPLRVNLVGVRVVDMQLFEQRYALTIRVQNPNPQDFHVAGLDFGLSINGESFAEGVSNQRVAIPAYGEVVMEVQVSSSWFRLFDQIRALEENAGEDFKYRISGSVSLSDSWIRLPFEREGRIGISPSKPLHHIQPENNARE